MPIRDGVLALSEKEKQTLRLIVRGHDAKSSARSLGLSVHTINERLRDARRKLAVSSSREAARLLLEVESDAGSPTPDLLGDTRIGEAVGRLSVEQEAAPIPGVGRAHRAARILIGVLLMTLALGLLALLALPQAAAPPAPPIGTDAPDAAVVETARHFLTLLDQSKWDESYRATATSFHKLNTLKVWTAVSKKVRAPLGAAQSRTFISQEEVPTPPHGYEMVKFRTSFANKPDAVETVTLDREGGVWRIAGVTVG